MRDIQESVVTKSVMQLEIKIFCETCTMTDMVMVFGKITGKFNVDYEKIVINKCRKIIFVFDDVRFDIGNYKVLINI